MRTYTKYIAIFLSLAVFVALPSCEKYSDPGPQDVDLSNLRVTHTIAELKALYEAGGYTILHDVVIQGKVSTEDTEGNLYRTMDIEDETGGIELKMGLSNLTLRYKRGSTVYVKCAGLTLGQYGGVVNLGYHSVDPKYETGFVPDRMVPKVLIAGAPGEIQARPLKIEELSMQYANTLIRLDDVQFVDTELGETWADAKNKELVSAVNRTLVDRNGRTVIVRTSSYARFAAAQLPEGSGSVVALLTFFNGTPQLTVIKLADIDMHATRFVY